jgi:4'-phosphopantetheinyl transferase
MEKPSLDGSSLQFNVSHGGAVGIVALARDAELGVDVEAIDTTINLAGLPELVLTRRERAVFETLPADRRHRFFFEHWVCKGSRR